MRLSKLFSAALLSMAITITSCSGEDGMNGEDGDPGAPGLNGTPGTNGVDGTDGINCWDLNGDGLATITTDDDTNEDINGDGKADALDCQGATGETGEVGNANVQAFIYLVNDLVNANYDTLNIPLDVYIDVENDNISNYAYLVYLETTNGLIYSIPGHGANNTHYARVFVDPSNVQINIQFYDLDDNSVEISQNTYDNVIVVAIELTNNSNNGGGQIAKGGSEAIEATLKAAGVDADDYDSVAAFFGL